MSFRPAFPDRALVRSRNRMVSLGSSMPDSVPTASIAVRARCDVSHAPTRWPILRSRRGKKDHFGRAGRSAGQSPIWDTSWFARLPLEQAEISTATHCNTHCNAHCNTHIDWPYLSHEPTRSPASSPLRAADSIGHPVRHDSFICVTWLIRARGTIRSGVWRFSIVSCWLNRPPLVFVYVGLDMWIYIYVYTRMCTYVRIYVWTYIYVYTRMCTYVHIYVCTYIYIHISIYIYIHMYAYTYLYIHISMYMYIYIYISLHMYTYIFT